MDPVCSDLGGAVNARHPVLEQALKAWNSDPAFQRSQDFIVRGAE